MNKIAIVSMVRDEADVIESFVRHHLAVADLLCIIDHASVDGTSDILAKLQDEGLPLAVLRYDGVAQLQAECLTQLLATAIEDGGADLVLPLDADEFVWPAEGQTLADVRRVLQALPTTRVYQWPWVRCTLTQPEAGRERLLSARPAVRAEQAEPIGKVFVGRAAFEETRAVHGRWSQGNHHFVIDGSGGAAGEPSRIVPEPFSDAFLAHFPWRSPEQAAAKEAVGWLANVAKYSRQTTKANHWRKGFARVLAGETVDDPMKDVPKRPLASPWAAQQASHPDAGTCAHDCGNAAAASPKLRYPVHADGQLLHRVLLAAENLAEAYREEQVASLHRCVSIVLLYLGDAEAFRQTLAEIAQRAQEDRMLAELLVLPLVDDAFAAQLPAFLGAQAIPNTVAIRIVEGATQAARFDDLRASATSDYVTWAIPGMHLPEGKLLPLVTALESDATLTCILRQESARGALELPMTEPFQTASGTDLAAALQKARKPLAGGPSAALFRRATMEQHAWMERSFANGRFREDQFWQAVLPNAVIGVMRTSSIS